MEERFEGIRGHERQKDILKRQLENDLISHAYLFTGPSGIGKKMIAERLAVGIIKNGLRNKNRRVSLEHADIFIIGTDEEKKLKVADIRGVIAETKNKPLEGSNRAIIIDHADTMNDVTQNALLKTIEEPNPGNTFILITDNPTKLLPTIKSRCQELPFHDISEEDKLEIIAKNGLDPSMADFTETPGSILKSLKDPEHRRELESLYLRLLKVMRGDQFEAFRLAEDLAQNKNFSTEALNLFIRRLHSEIMSSPEVDVHKINVLNLLFDLLGRFSNNVNIRMQWEGCLARILMLNRHNR